MTKIVPIVSILLSLAQLSVRGQTTISGKLLDETQKPVPYVSVSYKKVGSTAIMGFAKTDQKGVFSLAVKIPEADSVQLDFNHLSYAKKSVVVANKTADYTYTLRQETRQIEEVKVSDMPIFKRKDTINYRVDAFTSKQDRVIGDIIRKLPGIEMQGDRILYQGKPIQKYMVNNLDLMEGRYGMINNNLPADAVKNVQVVENDQPIKILDSLVFSDRASLNLELKKFTATGSGKVGVGLVPLLWDVNVTPMTFGKTFQMLNSFQSNNTGHDVAKDLRPFYTGGGYFRTRATVQNGPSYLSIREVSSPSFDESKWLDNKIFLFSTNVLQKLKSGIELKGNVSYYDDTRQRKGFTATQYFATEEVIVSQEAVDNSYRINVLNVGALLEKNEKQLYLRNNLSYHKHWNPTRGNLLFNQTRQITQNSAYTDEAFLNSLSLARFIGRQLVNIGSTVEYHRTPQKLTVSPGQFQDLLHGGEDYEQMAQHVQYTGLQWNNNLGFMRKIKRWTLSPDIALNYSRNQLDTYVSIKDQDDETELGADYTNDMDNSSINLSTSLRIGWESTKWKFNLTAPYNLYYFNVIQQQTKTLDNALRSTFNPSAGLTYLLNVQNELAFSLSSGRQYGGLNNFYNGYIIGQYRSMQRYDARLLRTDSKSARMAYNYKNTLKANFANLSYGYSQNRRDYIFTTHLDPQGRTTTSIADRFSESDGHSFSGGVSRFFATPKTVVKLNGSLGWSRSDYLLNGILSKQHVRHQSGTLEVINNLSNVVSGEYKTTLGQSISRLVADRQNRVFYNNHYLSLVVYPHERHSISLYNSYYRNNIPGQEDQFFLDAAYRYRLEKWKTDIELTANNLLNNQRYIQQFSSSIELVQSYFELRPRQFLLSTRFRF